MGCWYGMGVRVLLLGLLPACLVVVDEANQSSPAAEQNRILRRILMGKCATGRGERNDDEYSQPSAE